MDPKTFGLKVFHLVDEMEYKNAAQQGKEAVLRRIIDESRTKKKGRRQVEVIDSISTVLYRFTGFLNIFSAFIVPF